MTVQAAKSPHGHTHAGTSQATTKRHVRLMTYNIHHGRGTDGKYDLDRISRVIKSADPDIVALQEIEQFRARTHRHDQPAMLAEMLGLNHAYARVRTHCLRDSHHQAAYGNAILTKFPVLAEEHFSLSYTNTLEPRGCLHVTVDVSGKPLHVFCVHLGLRYRERHYQMERLLSEDIVHSPRFGSGPKILMGDFNNWWPVKSARGMHPHFENACVVTGRRRHGTFNGFFDVLCLDYIFASYDLKVESYEVIKNGAAKVASDHRPVLCSVSFKDDAAG
jgi:endonuclease/exonuclease/phosphatase family metal-dependent hydrolase